VTLLSWKPVNFDRWLCLAAATSEAAPVQASNLIAAVERMRVSWDRRSARTSESGIADTYLSVAVELGLKSAAAAARLVLNAGKRPLGGGDVRRRGAPVLVEITV